MYRRDYKPYKQAQKRGCVKVDTPSNYLFKSIFERFRAVDQLLRVPYQPRCSRTS